MAVKSYKDKNGKTKYYASFYYTDYNGQRKRKKLEGFCLLREAKQAEKDFLQKVSGSSNISFKNLYAIYLDDCKTRLKPSSIPSKEYIMKNQCLPFFGDTPINEITPQMVRTWQNQLLSHNPAYKKTYLRACNVHLSALFNYAVKYYGMKKNPVQITGTLGTTKSGRMDFYTVNEFKKFMENMKDSKPLQMAFELLFFTGIRSGELLAVTLSDFDVTAETLTINKTLNIIKGKISITTPKTTKSNRVITLPHTAALHLQEYINSMIEPQPQERLFSSLSKYKLSHTAKITAKKAGLKPIRLHDFRHSHASLLIELGFSPLLISQRLGHEDIQTTLAIYSHLYPNKANEVSAKLNDFMI